MIYNGTKLGYIDTDSRVKPYTEYQYMIISGNKAGKAESIWQAVLTKEAAPQFLFPPTVQVHEYLKFIVNISDLVKIFFLSIQLS